MNKKQTEVIPFMNHGRWVFSCPRCRTFLEASADQVICGVCHPGIRAKALKPVSGGAFRPVPDEELIAEARKEAEERGEHYVMQFPAERAQIESIVRLRKRLQDVNWHPGESIQDLIEQSRAHGDPLPKGVK